MNAEKWIWLELTAFEPDSADFGVGSYLSNAGFTPDGVSFMLNAIDFVLLYDGMAEEYYLFDEVNGRSGGSARWTNYQLRGLVSELKKHGIKVFFSVFTFYWMSRSRKEFIARHPECAVVHAEQGKTRAVDVLSRLEDGTYLEDIFSENLYHIMCDYGFNGWHGPDWFGPGGTLKGSCSDNLIGQFAEYLGDKFSSDFELVTFDQPEKLLPRVQFIMDNHYLEYLDFLGFRWEVFWRKMRDTVKKAGGECMINSPHTRSSWEAGVSTGIDYKRIAALGVDYMIVETVAANFDLCNGNEKVRDRISLYNSVLQEIKMSVPEMKLLFLHCIKDSGESYDVLRHTPAKLEHEFFRLSNLFYCDSDGRLNRCADGFLVCLGNAIEQQEWACLRKIWDMSWDFIPHKAGDFVWLSDQNSLEKWRMKYLKYGVSAPSAYASRLTAEYDLHSAVTASIENLNNIDYPAAVFNFDCCDNEQIEALFNFRKTPLLLIGNIAGLTLPDGTLAASCCIDENYQLGAVILNGGDFICNEIDDTVKEWHCFNVSIFEKFPSMELPEMFIDTVGRTWRNVLTDWHKDSRSDIGTSDKLRTLHMIDENGNEILAVCSYAPHYIAPVVELNPPTAAGVKVSSFPEIKLVNQEGRLRTEIPYAPVNVPPNGILVLKVIASVN